MEGIETMEDDLRGHVIELYFGDFAPLKQRRFARRGKTSFATILGECMAGLPVSYRVDNDDVDAVDTNLLSDESSYYDALELIAEATICTIRQYAGVIEVVNPLAVRQTVPQRISKIYGDNNSRSTGKIINTITYKLKIPPTKTAEGVTDALKPTNIIRVGDYEYFETIPDASKTMYTSHPGVILATRKQDRVMWSYGSVVLPIRSGDYPESLLTETSEVLLTLDGEPFSPRTYTPPMTISASYRGGPVLGGEGAQDIIDESNRMCDEYGIYLRIALMVELVDSSDTVVAFLAPVDVHDAPSGDGNERYTERGEWAYKWITEWPSPWVKQRAGTIHMYVPGVGAGEGQCLRQRGLWDEQPKRTQGLQVSSPTLADIGDSSVRVRVTVYKGARLCATSDRGVFSTTSKFPQSLIHLIAKSRAYALLLDKVTISQPAMYADDNGVRYDVTAYLSNEITESVTYDTRVAGVNDIPAWAYNGSDVYLGFLPARLFESLYPIYGVRGKEYSLRIKGAPDGNYYTYDGDKSIQVGYNVDIYGNRTEINLQSISDDTYNGQEV